MAKRRLLRFAARKAAEILEHGAVHGLKLTEKQREKLLGAAAAGRLRRRRKA